MSVRTLFEHGLDELRAMLYPVVLGSGTRVFGETSDRAPAEVTTRPGSVAA